MILKPLSSDMQERCLDVDGENPLGRNSAPACVQENAVQC